MEDFNELIAGGLEKWLKERRDEYKDTKTQMDPDPYTAIDSLLDEARECFAMGFYPWSEENTAFRERDHY